MKIKIRLLFMIIFCLILLAGCESEKKTDEKVLQYINDQYGFNVDITYREAVNEGNMGDRVYIVEKTEEPKVQFSIYLEGMFKSEIVGDSYKDQLDAYELGQQFLQINKSELDKIGYYDVLFKNLQSRETTYKEINVNVKAHNKISLNDEKSLEDLYTFGKLLKEYNTIIQEDDYLIYSINVQYPIGNEQSTIVLYDALFELNDLSSLKALLLENTSFVNEALQ